MIRFLLKNKTRFILNTLREEKHELVNPCRGWYRIFYFVLREGFNFEEVEALLSDNQTLVMAFIVLNRIKDDDIKESDKEDITSILSFFNERGKDVILRFAYDNTGNASEKEPSSFKTVLNHAKAIAEVVNDNKEKVYILQGLMLGNWGEMHSSRFITTNKLSQILNIFEDIDDSIYLAVRKPSQWRELNPSFSKNPGLDGCRIGIFNDGMLGSHTDLGTYGDRSKDDVGYRCEWKREEEIVFIHNLSDSVPIGGEVIDNNNSVNDLNAQVSQIKKSGISYLNSEHDVNLLYKWKNCSFNGYELKNNLSLYDYIGDYLGYRFVIKKCKVRNHKDNQTIVEIKIENTGFSPIYFDTEVLIEISNGANGEIHRISNGLNDINSGKSRDISACFKDNKGDIFVYAIRTSDSKRIFFANECEENAKVCVGRLE